jgi:mRNA interferase RelE/StbE
MYTVVLSPSARRFFERADAPLQRRLDRCFTQLKSDPRRHPNIKALKGKLAGYHRYRVGDYRVIYRIQDGERVVIVVLIVHRSQAYE